MIRILLYLALAAGAFLAWPTPTRAAESYDNCTGFIDSLPATIGTQGVWCLRKDLSTAMTSGNAIEVVANNVTLDCNDFKIGGLAAGAGSQARGVYTSGRMNITVRNCNVRGFHWGIALSGGAGHLIEDNRLDQNLRIGIYLFSSENNRIRRNAVYDTGGATGFNESTGIFTGVAHADIENNTVAGVFANAANSWAYGIKASAGGTSVRGNQVRGLVASGSGLAYGIYNSNSGRLVVRDNDIHGSGAAGSTGVRCSNSLATARDNVISGFDTAISNCQSAYNTINPL